jgi:hypothetical protein
VVRTRHDRFAKEWLKELLRDFGEVKTEREVSGEVRSIDLIFSPHPDRSDDLQALGLLGRILSRPACSIEFFRNAVPAAEIVNCRDKGADLRSELRRLAEQQDEKIRTDDLPMLWIFTPTLSDRLQRIFQMEQKPGWEVGIYFLPKNDFTAIIAIHQLPMTIDTLWIRLLGKGSVQANAVKELLALPQDYTYRRSTLRHLAILQVSLEIRQNKSRDLQEVMMNLMPAYEQWEAEKIAEGEKRGRKLGKEEGKKEGKKEGKREGKKEGKREGKREGLKLGEERKGIEIALRMLERSMPIAEIADLTGLTIEQIQSLH